MSPELLVDLVFVPPALWYVPEKSADQIEAIAPTLGMAMLNLDLLQIIENFAKLAGGLGADLSAPLVTEAKTAFEASVTEVRAAVSANPGLRVLGISRSADKVWVANADQHPDFAYLKSLGVMFVDHQGKPTDYFTEVSYEELDKFSGDVIFDDARDRSIRSGADELATWKALPAVKAGQVFDWKAAAPYSYLTSAPILADVARALSGATRVTGANG
jgi:iron complex transport system substrate-binding protein